MTRKTFIYKVYDSNVLIAVWSKDVISEPSFTSVINGMAGQMTIDLARTFENYGENVDVKLDNRVDCIIYDNEAPQGKTLYIGYISSYEPRLEAGRQYIRITLLPLFAQANRHILKDGSDTTVTYNSQDPSDIFTDIYNKMIASGATFVAQAGSMWDVAKWDIHSWDYVISLDIDDTNTVVSYTFNTNTCLEGMEKCVELAPANWYWYVGPDGTLGFKQKTTDIIHDISIGIHIEDAVIQQRTENMTNEIYFTGGGDPALFRRYIRQGSVDTYGRYAKKIVDQRVTVDATADTIANKKLDEEELPETRLAIVLPDNNGVDSNKGYDIESLIVGQTLRIKNLDFGTQTNVSWDNATWDIDVWDFTLQSVAQSALLITKIKYHPDYAEIETSSRFPVVAKRIEDINRNLVDSQQVNNPTSPTDYS